MVGTEGSHSKLVGRGKYVHEKITHAIIPSKRDEYVEAAGKYYKALAQRGVNGELGGVKLTGSWETVVGSVGDFTHILEYEGHKGYDATSRALKNDKVSSGFWCRGLERGSADSIRKCRICLKPSYHTSTLANTKSCLNSHSGRLHHLETLDSQTEESSR